MATTAVTESGHRLIELTLETVDDGCTDPIGGAAETEPREMATDDVGQFRDSRVDFITFLPESGGYAASIPDQRSLTAAEVLIVGRRRGGFGWFLGPRISFLAAST
ncbi:cytochrome P450 [Striga asiatica]|uniref:Cytochrome P450 n=1 Tax=Striga asiatica TaxID=4170 RepID=A0A5A7QQA3_STRAF|nr:cytochrome P450 [Striga asiatica]